MRGPEDMELPELRLAAEAPFPITSVSKRWCEALGVKEADILGCGFKVFDADFRPLTQSKVAAYGGTDDFSNQVTPALTVAVEQRRDVYLAAFLDLDAQRAGKANCPPTRKVALRIQPPEPAHGIVAELRLTLTEQSIVSMKDAMSALVSGDAAAMTQISKPNRICHVSATWKAAFGLDDAGSVGRSLNIIEGPLTQQGMLAVLHDAAATGAEKVCELVVYHANGQPRINKVRVVPVMGDARSTQTTGTPLASSSGRQSEHAAMAAACGVTHVLWYMDVQEAVSASVALSEEVYAMAPKALLAADASAGAEALQIVDVNDAWCMTFDRVRAELVGSSLPGFRPDGSAESGAGQEVIRTQRDGSACVSHVRLVPVIHDHTGVQSSWLAVATLSASKALCTALAHEAKAAVVVSAAHPHRIVHMNTAWARELVPDFLHSAGAGGAANRAEGLVGKELSAVALVAPGRDAGGSRDSEDLMELTQNSRAGNRILLAPIDVIKGCGAWLEAGVAPVMDVHDPGAVRYFVVSLDLTVAQAMAAHVPLGCKEANARADGDDERYFDFLMSERALLNSFDEPRASPSKQERAKPALERIQDSEVPSPRGDADAEARQREQDAIRAWGGNAAVSANGLLRRSCEEDSNVNAVDSDSSDDEDLEAMVQRAKAPRTGDLPWSSCWVPLSQRQPAREVKGVAGGLALLKRSCEAKDDNKETEMDIIMREMRQRQEQHKLSRRSKEVQKEEAKAAAPEAPRLSPAAPAVSVAPLLKRTCEDVQVACGEDGDSEEEYMDSEEEQQMIGCKLPHEEMRRALQAVIDKRSMRGELDSDTDGDECMYENEDDELMHSMQSAETVQSLKQRTKLLSDQELFQAIRLHQNHPDSYGEIEQQEDSLSDADDESTDAEIDLLAGWSRHGKRQAQAVSKGRCVNAKLNREEVEAESHRPSGLGLSGMFRDERGMLWQNSEVFTSVRVHVPDGMVIAPIYDEYLNVLRSKGLVESWHWPDHHVLSMQLPFGRVEKSTSKSEWVSKYAPDLTDGQMWWRRMRYLVAVIQHTLRTSDKEEAPQSGGSDKNTVKTIMMPRGSVTKEQRELGLVSLRHLKVIESWAWDADDAVSVILFPARLREACAQSEMCQMWAPPRDEDESWGVHWLRLVWLTTQQSCFVEAVPPTELKLDMETCLCSLHLHGLLSYD